MSRLSPSREQAGQARQAPIFFGWWILFAAVVLEFLISLLVLQSFGTYAAVWRDEFGWSATVLALAYSLHRAETGLLGPVQGWLIQRLGTRVVMLGGVILMAVGFALLSRMDDLLTFFVAFGFLAIGGGLCGMLSLSTVLVNWFDRKRGLALASLQAGLSLGGIGVPLVALTITTFGWRFVALGSGILILAAGLPLLGLIRGSPEELGLEPDGTGRPARRSLTGEGNAVRGTGKATTKSRQSRNFSLASALRTRSFWMLSIGHSTGVAVMAVVMVHLVIYLTEGLGLGIQRATSVVALMTVATLVGHGVVVLAGDRLPRHQLAATAMLGHMTAMLAIALSDHAIWIVYFAVVNGLAWGVRAPLMTAIRADYFGRHSFPTISGVSSMIVMSGSMMGPVVVGAVADMTGGYTTGFLLFALLALVGFVLFLLATRPVYIEALK